MKFYFNWSHSGFNLLIFLSFSTPARVLRQPVQGAWAGCSLCRRFSHPAVRAVRSLAGDVRRVPLLKLRGWWRLYTKRSLETGERWIRKHWTKGMFCFVYLFNSFNWIALWSKFNFWHIRLIPTLAQIQWPEFSNVYYLQI